MEQKIIFRKIRNYREIINITAIFIRQNFGILAKSLTFIAFPFILIGFIGNALFTVSLFSMFGGLAAASTTNEVLNLFQNGSIGLFFIFLLILMIGFLLFMTTIYAYIQLYIERADFYNITVSDVSQKVFKDIGLILSTTVFLSLTFIAVLIPMAMLVFIPIIGILFFYIFFFYCLLTMSFIFMIRLIERVSFFKALKSSFVLIRGYWWTTFGVYFFTYIIVSCITFLPTLVVTILTFASGTFIAGSSSSIIIVIIQVFASVLNLFANSILFSAIALHYFSLVEIKEGVGMLNRIESLGEERIAGFDV